MSCVLNEYEINYFNYAYKQIQQLPGVVSVQSPHFWTLSTDKYVGGIKIEVSFNCDPRYIMMTVRTMLSQV
jgi:zinc transporter 5/7